MHPTPSDSTTLAPSSLLGRTYRQLTGAWRSSFLGSSPSIVPDGIPELRGNPLLGSLSAFRSDLIGLFQATSALGPISRFRMFRIPIHVVTDTKIAHEILIEKRSSFKKTRELSTYLQPLLGSGLLAAEGEVHQRNRKLLAPAFAAKRVIDYGNLMVEETIDQLSRWTPNQQVDMSEEMTKLTLAIVGRALFGRAMREEAEQIISAYTLAMRAMMKRITSLVQAPYSFPLPSHRKMRRAVDMIDTVVQRIIDHRRAEGGDHGDVLSMLLLARDEADGTGLTDKAMRDEVITLLAGHEATASALTWTWYELGRNPLVRAKLTAEIDGVLGTRPVTVADLPRLPYNLAVIEEALRLHPPVYALGREVCEDVEFGGHRFGARSTIFINMYGIYRRAEFYPDPLAFKPEHMAPELKKARPQYAYLPFGDGPRVCIGAHFAMLELQLLLATMVQRGTVEVEPGERTTDPLMTLRLRGPLPATVGPRRASAA